MSRISIVVASRNYGRYIGEALDSVQRQTFTDFDLAIIDDGSSDDTASIVQSYLRDPRIRYYPSNRLGQSRAKNLGIGLTSAAYIAYLDADDAWFPEKLDRQFRLMEASPKVGVSYCRRRLIGPDGDYLPTTQQPLHRGPILDRVMVQNSICFSSVMIRREVLEHVGGFDPQLELGIDFELWLRVGMHYEFDYINEPLVKYRTGHGNLSTRLCDRMVSAMSVKRRFLYRRGGANRLAPDQVTASWASTYRTMGYLQRSMNVLAACKWYGRAMWTDGQWGRSCRSMLASTACWMQRITGGETIPVAAENRPENV